MVGVFTNQLFKTNIVGAASLKQPIRPDNIYIPNKRITINEKKHG
jgi:hypothetical protein